MNDPTQTDAARTLPVPRSSTAARVAIALTALIFAAIALGAYLGSGSRKSPTRGQTADAALQSHDLAAAGSVPNLFKPIAPDQAYQQNMAVPAVRGALEQAPAFVLSGDDRFALWRRKAVDCLTAAVFYESASESPQGQRAVAQVVLNRVRHPAYPKSVCGVVYQGSERRTGCQFTFTCDGSLARRPSREGWARARKVAEQALAGQVEPSVGTATHYHTVFVVPYWSPSLEKLTTIGDHIFYRFAGAWGKRTALRGVYAGEDEGGADTLEGAQDVLDDANMSYTGPASTPGGIVAGTLVHPKAELSVPATNATLRVDESRGKLIADEPGAADLRSTGTSLP